MRIHQVDPATFVQPAQGLPEHGRGAWTKTGIDFDYRYALNTEKGMRIGTRAEESLDHWAVGAGTFAIQNRLIQLGIMAPLDDNERGVFGPRTQQAVKDFQSDGVDPDGDVPLVVDGIVGRSDARALFTPLIKQAQREYGIPNDLLLGETNHESALDPGAIGYYIYYPDYRGVDRSMSQINAKANDQVSWLDAFDPAFALDWSAKRLRAYFNRYDAQYPKKANAVLWDAAVCAHNNPWAANEWAKTGSAPSETAAAYVNAVKVARY